MKEYLTLETNKKEAIVQNIKQTLIKETNIIFAFIFGSFLDALANEHIAYQSLKELVPA